MTPSQKAIDLARKFEGLAANPFDGKSHIRLKDSVRQRALICCDEVITEIEPDEVFQNYSERVTYWRDVKEEIQKL